MLGLVAIVSIALDMMICVAAAFWISALITTLLPIGSMSYAMDFTTSGGQGDASEA